MTKTSASKGHKLNETEYKFLLWIEQYYWRRGLIPSYELACKEPNVTISEEFYYACWENPIFLEGLINRGLPDSSLMLVTLRNPEESKLKGDSGFQGDVLTEKQLTVANSMLDLMDSRSRIKKLTELGVTTAEYAIWLRDPVYREYVLERSEALLIDHQPDAHIGLLSRVRQGDLGAIKYFNALTGRYRERNEGVQINNVTNNFGVQLVGQIIEAIQRHVTDPKVLEALSEDIMSLAMGEPLPAASTIKVVAERVETRSIEPFKP